MDENLYALAKALTDVYEEAYHIYSQEVDMIIKNKIQNPRYIERTLDYIMDIYTDKGFYLFLKLCTYYSTINYHDALEYLEILKEQREEEYNDFIKKYQKK